MAAKRLWVLIASVVLVSLAAPSLARAAEDNTTASDFLVLAIKPEGDVKDYRLVPVGETSVDPVQYRDVVKSLPSSLFGGVIIRPYDERAELAQCRTACAANAKCGNFTYVRPGKDRPIGVCHLRRVFEKPAAVVAAAPVVENAAPAPELVVVSPAVRNERPLVAIDSTRNGRALYTGDETPVTPVMFKFKAPVSNAKVDVRTRGRERVWANVEALDAKGRVFKRTGMWVAADGAAHQLLVRTDRDRIAALRVTTREPRALAIDGVDFVRATLVAEVPPAKEDTAAPTAPADAPSPVPEEATAEAVPVSPHAPATDTPADIVAPAQEAPSETVVAELPQDASETSIAVPIAPPAETPPAAVTPVITPIPVPDAEPQNEPQALPLLAAAGAAVLMLGGVGLYRQNYRKRTLARLTTSVVSDGFDRQTVLLTADEPDLSLRFSVRMPATVEARQTTITIMPEGEAA